MASKRCDSKDWPVISVSRQFGHLCPTSEWGVMQELRTRACLPPHYLHDKTAAGDMDGRARLPHTDINVGDSHLYSGSSNSSR
jgi:hypothetical protein